MKSQVDGRSLIPLLRDARAEWSDRISSSTSVAGRKGRSQRSTSTPIAACAARRWHLVSNARDGKKQWQLFDVKADPGEKTDVVYKNPEVVKKLDTAYDKWWDAVQPGMVNKDAVGPKVNPFKELYEKQVVASRNSGLSARYCKPNETTG